MAKLAAADLAEPRVLPEEDQHVGGDEPTVTHWKRMERSGLSSERGMKTTARYLVLFELRADRRCRYGSGPAPTARRRAASLTKRAATNRKSDSRLM